MPKQVPRPRLASHRGHQPRGNIPMPLHSVVEFPRKGGGGGKGERGLEAAVEVLGVGHEHAPALAGQRRGQDALHQPCAQDDDVVASGGGRVHGTL